MWFIHVCLPGCPSLSLKGRPRKRRGRDGSGTEHQSFSQFETWGERMKVCFWKQQVCLTLSLLPVPTCTCSHSWTGCITVMESVVVNKLNLQFFPSADMLGVQNFLLMYCIVVHNMTSTEDEQKQQSAGSKQEDSLNFINVM